MLCVLLKALFLEISVFVSQLIGTAKTDFFNVIGRVGIMTSILIIIHCVTASFKVFHCKIKMPSSVTHV